MIRIVPNLWFDTEAEEAAAFYTAIFKNSRITNVSHYGEAGPREAGMVMTASFELDGQPFTAINGGPEFPFTEAVSLEIICESQAEVDELWARLGDGGVGHAVGSTATMRTPLRMLEEVDGPCGSGTRFCAPSSGRCTVNVEPRPGPSLAAVIRPPCICVSCRASDRPSPRPR